MEPRKLESFGCRRCRSHGRQHGRARYCERPPNPAWSKTLACVEALCTGTGRSRVWPADGCRNIKEPLMYPYELGQMQQGQSVLFTARGHVLRSYFPDAAAKGFAGVADMMAEAARNIRPPPRPGGSAL